MSGRQRCWIALSLLLAARAYAVDTAIPFVQANAVHALGILGQKVVVAVVDDGYCGYMGAPARFHELGGVVASVRASMTSRNRNVNSF